MRIFRALDSIDGSFGFDKRALNAMDGDGFGFNKRALNSLESENFGFKKRALDAIDGNFGFNKRYEIKTSKLIYF